MVDIPIELVLPDLKKACNELKCNVTLTSAHRRKFQLAVNQFSNFVDSFIKNCTLQYIQTEQIAGFRYLIKSAQQYNQIFGQHYAQTWANTVLNSDINQVALKLCNMTSNLRKKTSCLNSKASLYFDDSTSEWLQYHLIDLEAIKQSTKQYLDTNKHLKQTTIDSMFELLGSIEEFAAQTAQAQSNGVVSSYSRFFSPIPVQIQEWRIDWEDFDIGQEVGKGVSATVYFGKTRESGRKVAIKKLKFETLKGNLLKSFQREISVLSACQHRCLVGFVGATDTFPYTIVTEWMPGGTLYAALRKNRLSPTEKVIAAFDIARGMEFLHSRQVMHRDLKSLNVILDEDGRCKLCDFGLSKHLLCGYSENHIKKNDQKNDYYKRKESLKLLHTASVGTPHWMAPEVLIGGDYGLAADVFSFGVILWELASNKPPYEGLSAAQIIAIVTTQGPRLEFDASIPKEWQELTRECWQTEQSKRPTFREIVKKLKEGQILLEGADSSDVKEYCFRAIAEDRDIVSTDLQRILDSLESTKDYIGLLNFTENSGVPNAESGEVLAAATHIEDCDTKARILGTLLMTEKGLDAASMLASMPSDSVSEATVERIAGSLPVGVSRVDDMLTVWLCRQGGAWAVLQQAVSRRHLETALEVITRRGVEEKRKTAAIDICLDLLRRQDEDLSASVLRALIGLESVRLVRVDVLRSLMLSFSPWVSATAHAAVCEAANEGVKLPDDLMDMMLGRWAEDELAEAVVLAGLRNVDVARYFVSRVQVDRQMPPEQTARALGIVWKHLDLRIATKIAAERLLERGRKVGMSNECKNILQKFIS